MLPIFISPFVSLMFLVPWCCTEDGGFGLVFVVAVDDRLCRCEQGVAVESRDMGSGLWLWLGWTRL